MAISFIGGGNRITRRKSANFTQNIYVLTIHMEAWFSDANVQHAEQTLKKHVIKILILDYCNC